MRRIREADTERIYKQYIDKIGELVNGEVIRLERGNIIVDMGNGLEALLLSSQQSRAERWNKSDRIRAVIVKVHNKNFAQQVELSRIAPELLPRLFEQGVDEIADGKVVIKSAAREPGERSKIAVMSTVPDLDPVAVCLGNKNSRVQSVSRELKGEKIDVIEWSDDPTVLAARALTPAKVNEVRIIDTEARMLEVILSEGELPLASGRRGENLRVATKLVGWRIHIRDENEPET